MDRTAEEMRVYQGVRGEGPLQQGQGDPYSRVKRPACRVTRHGKYKKMSSSFFLVGKITVKEFITNLNIIMVVLIIKFNIDLW